MLLSWNAVGYVRIFSIIFRPFIIQNFNTHMIFPHFLGGVNQDLGVLFSLSKERFGWFVGSSVLRYLCTSTSSNCGHSSLLVQQNKFLSIVKPSRPQVFEQLVQYSQNVGRTSEQYAGGAKYSYTLSPNLTTAQEGYRHKRIIAWCLPASVVPLGLYLGEEEKLQRRYPIAPSSKITTTKSPLAFIRQGLIIDEYG